MRYAAGVVFDYGVPLSAWLAFVVIACVLADRRRRREHDARGG